MRFQQNLPPTSSGFQMAPMIDVVFILLMFFMVASVWAQWETKVGISLPKSSTGIPTQRVAGEIIINLDQDGRIFINDIEQEPEHLRSLLAQINASFGTGQPVIIRADRTTDYEAVVMVLDICRDVEIWNVSFATLPEKSESPAPPTP